MLRFIRRILGFKDSAYEEVDRREYARQVAVILLDFIDVAGEEFHLPRYQLVKDQIQNPFDFNTLMFIITSTEEAPPIISSDEEINIEQEEEVNNAG
jgi:hypothetical protein